MKDFNTLCPVTFSSLEIVNEIERIVKSLKESFLEDIKKHEPSLLEVYKVT
jgi:hypothetical protein